MPTPEFVGVVEPFPHALFTDWLEPELAIPLCGDSRKQPLLASQPPLDAVPLLVTAEDDVTDVVIVANSLSGSLIGERHWNVEDVEMVDERLALLASRSDVHDDND